MLIVGSVLLSGLYNPLKRSWLEKTSNSITAHPPKIVKQLIDNSDLVANTPRTASTNNIKINIPKWVFTTKIAYMIYTLTFILIVLFVKYKLDIMKEEHYWKMKKEYRNRD